MNDLPEIMRAFWMLVFKIVGFAGLFLICLLIWLLFGGCSRLQQRSIVVDEAASLRAVIIGSGSQMTVPGNSTDINVDMGLQGGGSILGKGSLDMSSFKIKRVSGPIDFFIFGTNMKDVDLPASLGKVFTPTDQVWPRGVEP